MRIILMGLGLIAYFSWTPGAWAQAVTPEPKEKKFQGEAALLTNYVWHGLTQTKRNPAIQTSLFYSLAPVLKIGMWGSNVSYYGRPKANATLKLIADLKVDISQNFGMGFRFADNRYFESDDRDGNTFTIKLKIYDYNVNIEQESNWLGTVSKTRYYSVQKTWDVFSNWKWNNQLGYTMFETLNLKNYFDVRSFIGKKSGIIFWEAGLTFTDDNTQFADNADYFIVLQASAEF